MSEGILELIQLIGIWIICAAAAERIAEILTASDLLTEWRMYLSKLAYPENTATDNAAATDASLEQILEEDSNGRGCNAKQFFLRKLHKVFTCGMCMSVWTSFACSFAIESQLPVIIKTFGLVLLANTLHSSFKLLHKGRVNTHDHLIKLQVSVDDGDQDV